MTLSPRDRRAILLGAAVLAIILVGKVVAIPWVDKWRSAHGQITKTSRQLESIRKQLREVLW